MSRSGNTLLAGGLALVILAGCSSTPSGSAGASSDPTPGTDAFTEADVQQVVDDLAGLGIETRVRPTDATPITAVTGEPSAVRLLRHQVRNLALEGAGGGGTRGADLDAVTAAADGGPISALIAGWAATGATPGAQWAASLFGTAGPSDATARVYSTLALLAFVADVGGSGGVSSRPSNLLVIDSDYCAEVSAYLSATLDGVIDSTANPPPWMKQLIELYAPQYSGNPELLRKTIGALALLTYATSLARPWTVSLVPDPAAIAYNIQGEELATGEVDLTVLSGANAFGDDVADCASLADAQLASVPVEGSSVVWDTSGLGVHASEVAGQSQVDDTGVAALTYVPAVESREDAENGDAVTAQMWVNGWADRAEMTALGAIVKSILLGDAAGSPAGATAKALYLAMESTLNTVMRPSGFALIDVTYHQPKASPSPSQAEAGLTGTWDGTWVIDGYGNTGAFTMELVQTGGSFSGPVEITNTDCSNGTVDGTVDGTSVTFGWVITPQPVQFTGVLNGTSMNGAWSAYACSDATLFLTGTWEATRRS